MNRYLPVARQHFLAVLASTSVVVKSICAAVILLYLLSFAVDTVFGLGVTPGYLFPPNFWIWTLATHSLVEKHVWDVGVSLATVVLAGRLLEPLWGALELLIFFAVVNISVGLLGAFAYFLTYVGSFNLLYLFTVRIHGMLGFLGGVLVALKQTMGDSTVLKVPQVRMKVVPMLLLLILAVLRLTTLIESNLLASYGFGVLSSWIYLRFYQRHSRGRGDMSDHFAFATFFPEILQPVIGLVANLVHGILVKVKVCRKTVKRYDVGAPSSITISLPGTDPQDAERRSSETAITLAHVAGSSASSSSSRPRFQVLSHSLASFRQLALKALNERLKRVEDQSAWPSMEDDEDEGGPKADSPLLPEKSQSSRDANAAGKGASQESSLITFEDAPPQL
ncbi:transmembrane protein 115 isoform X1 [Gopherus flavomarginatus]|uniref:transmembrane protein 115 isoform X1 n=1 Tax=Gopherus flavomarginatus TaxID=286002 RepID=UPI0021CBB4AA|nr:transmembrane protein 115 isoform X1 [Gopherus flavomarginatus]